MMATKMTDTIPQWGNKPAYLKEGIDDKTGLTYAAPIAKAD